MYPFFTQSSYWTDPEEEEDESPWGDVRDQLRKLRERQEAPSDYEPYQWGNVLDAARDLEDRREVEEQAAQEAAEGYEPYDWGGLLGQADRVKEIRSGEAFDIEGGLPTEEAPDISPVATWTDFKKIPGWWQTASHGLLESGAVGLGRTLEALGGTLDTAGYVPGVTTKEDKTASLRRLEEASREKKEATEPGRSESFFGGVAQDVARNLPQIVGTMAGTVATGGSTLPLMALATTATGGQILDLEADKMAELQKQFLELEGLRERYPEGDWTGFEELLRQRASEVQQHDLEELELAWLKGGVEGFADIVGQKLLTGLGPKIPLPKGVDLDEFLKGLSRPTQALLGATGEGATEAATVLAQEPLHAIEGRAEWSTLPQRTQEAARAGVFAGGPVAGSVQAVDAARETDWWKRHFPREGDIELETEAAPDSATPSVEEGVASAQDVDADVAAVEAIDDVNAPSEAAQEFFQRPVQETMFGDLAPSPRGQVLAAKEGPQLSPEGVTQVADDNAWETLESIADAELPPKTPEEYQAEEAQFMKEVAEFQPNLPEEILTDRKRLENVWKSREVATDRGEGGYKVVFADLDLLHHVNKTRFGMEAGDAMLSQASALLQDEISRRDLDPQGAGLFRVGGDEFAMVLRGTEADIRAALDSASDRMSNGSFVVPDPDGGFAAIRGARGFSAGMSDAGLTGMKEAEYAAQREKKRRKATQEVKGERATDAGELFQYQKLPDGFDPDIQVSQLLDQMSREVQGKTYEADLSPQTPARTEPQKENLFDQDLETKSQHELDMEYANEAVAQVSMDKPKPGVLVWETPIGEYRATRDRRKWTIVPPEGDPFTAANIPVSDDMVRQDVEFRAYQRGQPKAEKIRPPQETLEQAQAKQEGARQKGEHVDTTPAHLRGVETETEVEAAPEEVLDLEADEVLDVDEEGYDLSGFDVPDDDMGVVAGDMPEILMGRRPKARIPEAQKADLPPPPDLPEETPEAQDALDQEIEAEEKKQGRKLTEEEIENLRRKAYERRVAKRTRERAASGREGVPYKRVVGLQDVISDQAKALAEDSEANILDWLGHYTWDEYSEFELAKRLGRYIASGRNPNVLGQEALGDMEGDTAFKKYMDDLADWVENPDNIPEDQRETIQRLLDVAESDWANVGRPEHLTFTDYLRNLLPTEGRMLKAFARQDLVNKVAEAKHEADYMFANVDKATNDLTTAVGDLAISKGQVGKEAHTQFVDDMMADIYEAMTDPEANLRREPELSDYPFLEGTGEAGDAVLDAMVRVREEIDRMSGEYIRLRAELDEQLPRELVGIKDAFLESVQRNIGSYLTRTYMLFQPGEKVLGTTKTRWNRYRDWLVNDPEGRAYVEEVKHKMLYSLENGRGFRIRHEAAKQLMEEGKLSDEWLGWDAKREEYYRARAEAQAKFEVEVFQPWADKRKAYEKYKQRKNRYEDKAVKTKYEDSAEFKKKYPHGAPAKPTPTPTFGQEGHAKAVKERQRYEERKAKYEAKQEAKKAKRKTDRDIPLKPYEESAEFKREYKDGVPVEPGPVPTFEFEEFNLPEPAVNYDSALVEERARAMVNEQFLKLLEEGDTDVFARASTLYDERGIRKQRKDVPEYFREFLGEITDARAAIRFTAKNMANDLAMTKAAAAIFQEGMNLGLFSLTATDKHSHQIKPGRGSLSNIWTTPEVAEMLRGEPLALDDGVMRGIRLVGNLARVSFTATDPGTTVANFAGNLTLALAGGTIPDVRLLKRAIDTMRDPEMRPMLLKMGLLQTGTASEIAQELDEVSAQINQLAKEDPKLKGKGYKGSKVMRAKKLAHMFTHPEGLIKKYAAVDDVWKVASVLDMLDRMKDVDGDTAAKLEFASAVVRSTFPIFELAELSPAFFGPIYRFARKHNLGTFLMFVTEVPRNLTNSAKLGLWHMAKAGGYDGYGFARDVADDLPPDQDLERGNIRLSGVLAKDPGFTRGQHFAEGARRLGGLTAALVLGDSLTAALFNAWYGRDDEEDWKDSWGRFDETAKALQILEFDSENPMFFPTGEDATFAYMDMSRVYGHDPVLDSMKAITQSYGHEMEVVDGDPASYWAAFGREAGRKTARAVAPWASYGRLPLGYQVMGEIAGYVEEEDYGMVGWSVIRNVFPGYVRDIGQFAFDAASKDEEELGASQGLLESGLRTVTGQKFKRVNLEDVAGKSAESLKGDLRRLTGLAQELYKEDPQSFRTEDVLTLLSSTEIPFTDIRANWTGTDAHLVNKAQKALRVAKRTRRAIGTLNTNLQLNYDDRKYKKTVGDVLTKDEMDLLNGKIDLSEFIWKRARAAK